MKAHENITIWDVIFYDLGDALRYGMTNELPDLVKGAYESNGLHLYASLAFLYLNGYITRMKVNEIYNIIANTSAGGFRRTIDTVARILFKELKKKVQFANFNELVEELNYFCIPDWLFAIEEQLKSTDAFDLILYDDNLYYIDKRDSGSVLVKMDTNYITSDTDLSCDIHRETLAIGYDKILGFDAKLQRIYLGICNQNSCFAFYDIICGDVHIINNRFYALVDGVLYVILSDDHIAKVTGDTVQRLVKYHCQQYETREKCFFIFPDVKSAVFFYPYYLYYDGHTAMANSEDSKKVLWRYINNSFEEIADSFHPWISEENKLKIPMPESFTITCIRNVMKNYFPMDRRYRDIRYVLFDNVLSLLDEFIPDGTDVLMLLYALCKSDKVLSENSPFPSWKYIPWVWGL